MPSSLLDSLQETNVREDYRGYIIHDEAYAPFRVVTRDGREMSLKDGLIQLRRGNEETDIVDVRQYTDSELLMVVSCTIGNNGGVCIGYRASDGGIRRILARPCPFTRDQALLWWQAADKLASLLNLFGVRLTYDDRVYYEADEKVVAYSTPSDDLAIADEAANWASNLPHVVMVMRAHARMWATYNMLNRVY